MSAKLLVWLIDDMLIHFGSLNGALYSAEVDSAQFCSSLSQLVPEFWLFVGDDFQAD